MNTDLSLSTGCGFNVCALERRTLSRLAKFWLFGFAVLIVAALTVHVAGCAYPLDHDMRIQRLDTQPLNAHIAKAKPDQSGASGGSNALTSISSGGFAVALWSSPLALESNSASHRGEFAQSLRNTALAHRRVTVLLI